MNPALAGSRRIPRRDGVALVVTLGMLVLVTVLVTGFAVNMRTERQAAAAMAETRRAELVAQGALAHAVALLERHVPQPLPPGAGNPTPVNWITGPGLLTTVTAGSASSSVTPVPLSSNPDTNYVPTAQDANLNAPRLRGNGYAMLPTGEPMRVAWVPVLADPARAAGRDNRLAARYAFWMDDESAKVNVNTALGKPLLPSLDPPTPGVVRSGNARYPVGHPASVNLDVFGPTLDRDALARWVTGTGPLLSPEGLKPFVAGGGGADADAFLERNRFNLTAWSRAPEFNVFGKSRLFLLRGGGGPRSHGFQFFRDLDAPLSFHGAENTAAGDGAAMYYTAKNLATILDRRDWPGMPARSFVDKWGGDDVARREADQVAWNLVARGNFADYAPYVTSAADPAVTPTAYDHVSMGNLIPRGREGSSGSVNVPNNTVQVGPLSGKAIVPAFPLPLVDEVCLRILPEVVPKSRDDTRPPLYRLKLQTRYALWLPPGYPRYDFRTAGRPTQIGLTYLSIEARQGGGVRAFQEDAKYITAVTPNGIRAFWAGNDLDALEPGRRKVLETGYPCYVRNGEGFSDSNTATVDFDPAKGPVALIVKMRLYARINANKAQGAWQLIPVWDRHDPGTTASTKWNDNPPNSAVAALIPPDDDRNYYLEWKFDISPALLSSGDLITRSLVIDDPRTGGLARSWVSAPGFNQPNNPKADGLEREQHAGTLTPAAAKKLAYLDFSNATPQSPRPPVGMFSTVPTGMQRGRPWSSFKLQPSGGEGGELPDWLLLDLFAPTVESTDANDVSAPSAFPLSRMNATAGKVNLNAALTAAAASSPPGGEFAPPARFLPLQAVFQNMLPATTVSGAPPSAPSVVVGHVLNHDLAAGGKDYGAPGRYDYVGELCEVRGVADETAGTSDWEKEALVRNLANCLTTQSNVFCVWGVGQTVRKNPRNAAHGTFEPGDVVTGEKRFQAVVERYVWPGVDASPGNAHVGGSGSGGSGGAYDRLSTAATAPGLPPPPRTTGTVTWEALDGPDRPTYPVSGNVVGPWLAGAAASYQPPAALSDETQSLEQALNPVRARMKYRVVAFRYLTD